jgi:hypothetical protein
MFTSFVSLAGGGSGMETGQSAPQTGLETVTYTSPPSAAGVSSIPSEARTCTFCDVNVHSKGMCQKHYRRWKKYGDAMAIGFPGGRGEFRREDDGKGLTYLGQHRRIEAARGFPSSCEICDENDPSIKYEWAFNNSGDRNNVNDYVRLCVQCHKNFDSFLMPRGEEHWNSKVTEDIVREIRYLYRNGPNSYRRLAKAFGISVMTVSDIVRYKTWAHVTEKPPRPEDQSTDSAV